MTTVQEKLGYFLHNKNIPNMKKLHQNLNKHGKPSPLVSTELYNVVLNHAKICAIILVIICWIISGSKR